MSEPIRILQHMRVLDSGGIEAFLFANYRAMDREKVVFDFLVTRDQEEFYDEEIKRLGGKKIVLEFKHKKNSGLNALSQAKAFYRFCKAQKHTYHVIHFQSIGANGFLDIMAAAMAGIPIRIAHSHIANDYKPARNSSRVDAGKIRKIYVSIRQAIIRRLVSRYSTHYFACSKMAAEWMYTKKINKNCRYKIVNNPINIEKFRFSESERDRIRKDLCIQDKIVIGHVGRFVYSKNHLFLLETFAKAVEKDARLVLVLVGGGILKNNIEAKIEELGIRDKVIMYGETTEVNKVYNAFDLFVFPSHYEGLGIVLVEAQANGLSVLAADTIPEEVHICSNFEFMSLSKGSEEWANTILKKAKEERALENYRKVITAGYDIKDVSKSMQDTYCCLHNDME